MSDDALHEARAVAGRGRVAPRAEETSDVTRFRGVLVAAIAAALVAVIALVATDGLSALRAPGPLSRPHRLAGLACRNCHGAKTMVAACTGCHGAHRSTRAGHRGLACPTCHAVHHDEAGVTIAPDGAVTEWAGGWARRVDVASAARPSRIVSVALVSARRCARCHDAASKTDPLWACLPGGRADGAQICFDEHRQVAGRAPERDAAWEVAREVATRPAPVARAALAGPVGWLGAGLAAALVVLVALRRRRRGTAVAEPGPVLQAAPVARLPRIDERTCLGCNACVDACPYDVIELRRYVAVVARPDECCGLTLCEQRCPNGSLVVRDAAPAPDRPDVDDALEATGCPGVYLAGDLTGLPLIRNAINQGAHAVRAIAASLDAKRDRALLDVVIVGAGPAGISAALEAKAQGVGYVVVEQSSVAASIKSFPRGKLVFDQPLGMPLIGDLWLDECTKEELLGKWLRVVRREALAIREGQRVTGVERRGDGFVVSTVDVAGKPGTLGARRVVFAVGRRGTPRRLQAAIPEAWEAHVHYSLADARSFAGRRVLVVGLGDSAMEAAIALSHQPGCDVMVAYRGSAFRRGKARNIDELRRLVEAGRVKLEFDSEVQRVEPGHVTLSGVESPSSTRCS